VCCINIGILPPILSDEESVSIRQCSNNFPHVCVQFLQLCGDVPAPVVSAVHHRMYDEVSCRGFEMSILLPSGGAQLLRITEVRLLEAAATGVVKDTLTIPPSSTMQTIQTTAEAGSSPHPASLIPHPQPGLQPG